MQRYLHPGDYTMQIRSEIKNFVGGVDEKKLMVAEQAAVTEMKAYLSKKYDPAKIFYAVTKWDAAIAYTIPVEEGATGTLVYYKKAGEADESYIVYEVIINTALGESPETHPAKWREFTGRNPFVIMRLVDMVLYHIHSKDASRAMPKVREDRYEDSIDWLKTVLKNGDIDAGLPIRAEDDAEAVPEIRYSSHDVENQRW